MRFIEMKGGHKVKIDDEDYLRFSRLKFHYSNGYAVHSYRLAGVRFNIFMHRLLLKVPHGMFIDHINGDKLDNRKGNLRLCTNSQNQYNRKKQRNNKSGYTGVSWGVGDKKWHAYGTIHTENGRKTVNLGGFTTKEEAHQAYLKHAKEQGGEFFNLS